MKKLILVLLFIAFSIIIIHNVKISNSFCEEYGGPITFCVFGNTQGFFGLKFKNDAYISDSLNFTINTIEKTGELSVHFVRNCIHHYKHACLWGTSDDHFSYCNPNNSGMLEWSAYELGRTPISAIPGWCSCDEKCEEEWKEKYPDWQSSKSERTSDNDLNAITFSLGGGGKRSKPCTNWLRSILLILRKRQ